VSQTYDAGDEIQVKAGKVNAKLAREIELEDLRAVLALPEARRVFARLVRFCRPLEPVVDNSGSITYFQEGRRNAGLFLLSEIRHADSKAAAAILTDTMETISHV
jgi:hypothetical protein